MSKNAPTFKEALIAERNRLRGRVRSLKGQAETASVNSDLRRYLNSAVYHCEEAAIALNCAAAATTERTTK